MYDSLQQNKLPWDKKTFREKAIQCYKCENEHEKQKLTLELFYMLGNLILHRINRIYLHYLNVKKLNDRRINCFTNKELNTEGYATLTKDDFAINSYLTLVDCIKYLDVNQVDKFPFYYNKTLRRKLRSFFEDEDYITINSTHNVENVLSYGDNFMISQIDMKILFQKFTSSEQRIIKAKLMEVKLEDILEQESISLFTYRKLLKSIKHKLNNYRNE